MVNNVQVKKSNDSYKLLNGKYPATIQRDAKIKNNNKFAIKELIRPICTRVFVCLKNDKLIQYVVIETNKTPKTILDEKF